MGMMRLLRRLMMPFAKRFVAGETVDSAISYVDRLNDDGIVALVDLLGEHVEDRGVAWSAQEEYIELLERMDDEGLDGGLSIKPTHLGLEIDEEFCRRLIRDLVEAAAERDRFVWLDMESSNHTDETIDIYEDLRVDFDNVGICIQCYLKRSDEDIARLIEGGGIVRLVKGAYDESANTAYTEKDRVDESFRELLEMLFAQDTYFAVGTHDEDLVAYAKELEKEYGKDTDAFEFQFLKGVKDGLKHELVEEGYTVAEYVPYGPEWLAYYWRRVRERRENLWFAVHAVKASLLGR